jgi:hypothetical protein
VSDPASGTEYLSLEDLLDLVNALGLALSGISACSTQLVTARGPASSARRRIRR